MIYKHILVAVDLSKESDVLLAKGASLAQAMNTKLSLIHIDASYVGLYTGMLDINIAEAHHRIVEEAQHQLIQLAHKAGVEVTHSFVGGGSMAQEVVDTIAECDIDLVVLGHHQDFWRSLLSSVNQLINKAPIDMLLIPLDR